MKTVGIITLHNVKNYGSALQTYATQYTLKKLNFDCFIINYYRKDLIDKNILNARLNNSKIFSINFITRFIGKIVINKSIKAQRKIFNDFFSNYIKQTTPYYSYNDLISKPPIADIYCTGSDQVWNSTWNGGIEKAYYLDFINSPQKIAYAASFGKTAIDQKEAKIIKPMLQKYQNITVREKSAIDILNQLGIKNSKLVLDPTLLLTKSEWEKISGNLNFKKPYILVYQLDSKNKEFDKYVKNVSKFLKINVIRISNVYYQKYKYGKFIFAPSVNDFVSLFLNAKYIITDSFHATAFSINFNKQFVTIYPQEFSTRIESILALTNLLDRKVSDYTNLSLISRKIDYKYVNAIIEKERQNSINILKKMLN